MKTLLSDNIESSYSFILTNLVYCIIEVDNLSESSKDKRIDGSESKSIALFLITVRSKSKLDKIFSIGKKLFLFDKEEMIHER